MCSVTVTFRGNPAKAWVTYSHFLREAADGDITRGTVFEDGTLYCVAVKPHADWCLETEVEAS